MKNKADLDIGVGTVHITIVLDLFDIFGNRVSENDDTKTSPHLTYVAQKIS